MPDPQPPSAAPAWTIRSVSLRRRDSAERLAQAYRHLLQTRTPARLTQRRVPTASQERS